MLKTEDKETVGLIETEHAVSALLATGFELMRSRADIHTAHMRRAHTHAHTHTHTHTRTDIQTQQCDN